MKIFKVPKFKYDAKTLLIWLWQAWQGNQLQAVLNASVGLLSVGVSLAQVWAVKRAIDVASHVVEGDIYWAVALMGFLILADFALNVSSVWIRNLLGIKAQNRMQQRMLDRILRSEWHGREKMHSGDVLNRLETDVSNVVNFLTETIPNTLSVLAMFLGAFFYLFSMDKVLSIVIVIMIPIFLAFSKIYVGKMRQLTRQVRDSDSKVQSVLQETIQHRMLIKTLEKDDAMVDKLENTQKELRGYGADAALGCVPGLSRAGVCTGGCGNPGRRPAKRNDCLGGHLLAQVRQNRQKPDLGSEGDGMDESGPPFRQQHRKDPFGAHPAQHYGPHSDHIYAGHRHHDDGAGGPELLRAGGQASHSRMGQHDE